MAELGTTTDPRALIAGDAEAARAIARSMTAYAGSLHEAAEGLDRVTTREGWSGDAGEAFRQRFAVQPLEWATAGDAFTEASRALDVYAETFDWATRQAADAVGLWQQAAAGGLTDIGEPGRRAAQDVLERARAQLATAGDVAADTLERLADAAPTDPGFWDDVIGDVAEGAADMGRDVVNAVASVGNAALHNPADVLAMAGGLGLIGLGLGGELGGFALDATVVGAPAGVSLNVASAAAIASGATMAGAGAIHVAQSAAGDDRVEPLEPSDATPTTSTPRPAATRPTVENENLGNIVRDLYRGVDNPGRTGSGTTADAIRAERATGVHVGDRLHTIKGNGYIRALRRWLRRNPDASPTDRGIAQNELNDLLDALGRTS